MRQLTKSFRGHLEFLVPNLRIVIALVTSEINNLDWITSNFDDSFLFHRSVDENYESLVIVQEIVFAFHTNDPECSVIRMTDRIRWVERYMLANLWNTSYRLDNVWVTQRIECEANRVLVHDGQFDKANID